MRFGRIAIAVACHAKETRHHFLVTLRALPARWVRRALLLLLQVAMVMSPSRALCLLASPVRRVTELVAQVHQVHKAGRRVGPVPARPVLGSLVVRVLLRMAPLVVQWVSLELDRDPLLARVLLATQGPRTAASLSRASAVRVRASSREALG